MSISDGQETERRSYDEYQRLLDRLFDLSEKNITSIAANTNTVTQVLELQKKSTLLQEQHSSDHRQIIDEVKTVGRFVTKTHWIVGIIMTALGLFLTIQSFFPRRHVQAAPPNPTTIAP